MSDPTQRPRPGETPDADDAAAALGPDAPTLAHPTTGEAVTDDLSGATGFPSAEPAIPVPPAEPGAGPQPPLPPDVPIPHGEPLAPAPPLSAAPAAPVSPPPPPPPVAPASPPPPPVTPFEAADDGGSGGPAAAVLAAAQERPEMAVGASFAGGLVLAMILKRLAR